MQCKRCGRPLPSSGIVCKFCGALMEKEQIDYQNKMRDKDNQRITLLSEKYGRENQITYREEKENKVIGIVVVAIILLLLIILTILINI